MLNNQPEKEQDGKPDAPIRQAHPTSSQNTAQPTPSLQGKSAEKRSAEPAGPQNGSNQADQPPKNPRFLIACDFDGTLYRHDGRGFLPQDLPAILSFRKKGGLVGINTGRCYRSIRNGLRPKELEILDACAFDFTCGSSGAEIADANEHLIKEEVIEWSTLKQMEQMLPCFISFASVDGEYWRNTRSLTPFSVDSPTYENIDELKGKHICTLTLLEEDPDCSLNLDELDRLLKKSGLPVESYYNMESIDVVPHGVSKATALEDLSRLFHVPMEHVYAIGDGMNDAPALQAAAAGFAIAAGDPGLHAVADYVVEDLAGALAIIESLEGAAD